MAEDDAHDGPPGPRVPDLGALDEDCLSADLEADLDGDFGEDALDEGGLDDSGDAGLDGEFEDSDEERDDDGGAAFGGSGFSGGFGAGGLSNPSISLSPFFLWLLLVDSGQEWHTTLFCATIMRGVC